jgi:hypothetical protein
MDFSFKAKFSFAKMKYNAIIATVSIPKQTYLTHETRSQMLKEEQTIAMIKTIIELFKKDFKVTALRHWLGSPDHLRGRHH